MRVKQYLRNQLPVIFIHVLGMLALALFLLANGNAVQTVLLDRKSTRLNSSHCG